MNSASLQLQWTSWTMTWDYWPSHYLCCEFCRMSTSHFRRSMVLLEGIRIAIVTLAAILLNQPEWIEEFRPKEKPTL